MFKLLQNYINFLIVCLIVSNLCFAQEGCTDPEAYNCEDDIWEDGNEYPNYIFEVGDIPWPNSCNYGFDDYLEIIYVGGCEDGPCEGYYDPDATSDDGSCDYYHAPHGDNVDFTVYENGINVDWTYWVAPENAVIIAYHVQRCTDQCEFITESSGNSQNTPYSCWPDCPIKHTDTFIFDDNPWNSGIEIKYAINVQYSNAEDFGMAIGGSYITPCSASLGDLNGDGGINVLDVTTLVYCVIGDTCADLTNSNDGDMNCDGGYNVLDIVLLANCIIDEEGSDGNCSP